MYPQTSDTTDTSDTSDTLDTSDTTDTLDTSVTSVTSVTISRAPEPATTILCQMAKRVPTENYLIFCKIGGFMMKADTALVVIDVQVGMFASADPVYQGDELLTKIASLLAKARQAGIPVIYIQHGSERKGHPLELGTTGWQIHPAVAPLEGDTIIHKHMPDSFYKTNLQQHLQTQGIKKLIITGIQTEMCVDTTCRRACSLDYDVTLVKDAHSTWNTELLTAPQIIAHHNALLGDWFVTAKDEQDILL